MAIKKRLFGCLFFIFEISTLLLIFFCYAQDQITLTAYYPAPRGRYREFSSYRMKIGRTYQSPNYSVSDNNTIVEGNVGIGKSNATTRLDVNGTLQITGFHLPQSSPQVNTSFLLVSNDTSGNAVWRNMTNTSSGAKGCRVSVGAVAEKSNILCNSTEYYVGNGALINSGSNNNVIVIVNDTSGSWAWPFSGVSSNGLGTRCINEDDSCAAQAVCCQF